MDRQGPRAGQNQRTKEGPSDCADVGKALSGGKLLEEEEGLMLPTANSTGQVEQVVRKMRFPLHLWRSMGNVSGMSLESVGVCQ